MIAVGETLEWNGIRFDYFEFDNGQYWTTICQKHVDEFKIPSELLDDAGVGICGVMGCDHATDKEYGKEYVEDKTYYLDIPGGEGKLVPIESAK